MAPFNNIRAGHNRESKEYGNMSVETKLVPRGRKPLTLRINGTPYCQRKVRGNNSAPKKWSNAIVEQTQQIEKINGPCKLRAEFILPPDKFPADHPHGPDLDNLLKRLWDALGQTVFSSMPGCDGCVVEVTASKRRSRESEECGAKITIEEV